MSVTLETAKRRERERVNPPAPILPASAYMLTGAELARECAGAVRAYPASRILSDAERDALAAMLAERVYRRRMGRGSARQVLAYIDRAERFPTMYAGSAGIPRGAVGREYLRREVASLMRDSREWRDVAESYQTRAERDAERGPMVESADAYADADALTRASAREVERATGEPLPALPIMSQDVAEGMALALATDGAPRRAVMVALCSAAGVPLASVAVALGFSLATAKRESAAGAKWMRENMSASDAVALMRQVADAYGHVIPADPNAPSLPASARVASDAVDACKREARRNAERGASPLPGRVDPPSTRDLRTIAGRVADAEPTAPRRSPAVAVAERRAALAEYAERVEALRSAGCEYPHTVAARSAA